MLKIGNIVILFILFFYSVNIALSEEIYFSDTVIYKIKDNSLDTKHIMLNNITEILLYKENYYVFSQYSVIKIDNNLNEVFKIKTNSDIIHYSIHNDVLAISTIKNTKTYDINGVSLYTFDKEKLKNVNVLYDKSQGLYEGNYNLYVSKNGNNNNSCLLITESCLTVNGALQKFYHSFYKGSIELYIDNGVYNENIIIPKIAFSGFFNISGNLNETLNYTINSKLDGIKGVRKGYLRNTTITLTPNGYMGFYIYHKDFSGSYVEPPTLILNNSVNTLYHLETAYTFSTNERVELKKHMTEIKGSLVIDNMKVNLIELFINGSINDGLYQSSIVDVRNHAGLTLIKSKIYNNGSTQALWVRQSSNVDMRYSLIMCDGYCVRVGYSSNLNSLYMPSGIAFLKAKGKNRAIEMFLGSNSYLREFSIDNYYHTKTGTYGILSTIGVSGLDIHTFINNFDTCIHSEVLSSHWSGVYKYTNCNTNFYPSGALDSSYNRY